MTHALRLISVFILVAACISSALAQSASAPDYSLREGDQISISVWGFDDLSPGPMQVRPDGKISFPTLGDIYVVGMTPEALSRVISSGVSRFVKNPRVTVTLISAVSEKYYVSGPVGKPGAYPFVVGTGVREAITAAGDLLLDADDQTAYILRDGQSIPVDLASAQKGDNTKNVMLKPGDTLRIDQALITLVGAVNNTGKVPLRRGSTLTQAIYGAGGPATNADVERVQVLRGGQTIVANMRDITANPGTDISLQPNDIVKVDTQDVRNVPVLVTGAVRSPGQYRYIEGYRDTLGDIVNAAGGVTNEADLGRVKIRTLSPDGDSQEISHDLRTETGRSVQVPANAFVEVPRKRRSKVGQYLGSALGVVGALYGIFR